MRIQHLGSLFIAFTILWPMHLAAQDKDRFDIGEAVEMFTLKTANPEESGETFVSLDRYYGEEAKEPKKAILLSFFATYCEPCKREMPYLKALHDTYKEKGLQVLMVSIDKESDKIEQARALANSHHITFPVLKDRFNIVAKRYRIKELPCVYLIDAQGKVALVNVGYSDDISRKLLTGVRQLVGEPTSDPVPQTLTRFVDETTTTTTLADTAPPTVSPSDATNAKVVSDKKSEHKKKSSRKKSRGRKRRRK
ncbi:MAG: TlpA disulfide reductase family protein [Myxococcota bacterium]